MNAESLLQYADFLTLNVALDKAAPLPPAPTKK